MFGGTAARPAFQRYKKYKQLMESLTLDEDVYLHLKQAFSGGFTHANARYVAICEDIMPKHCIENVASYDFNSSYPAIMVLKKFPMTKFRDIEPPKSKDELNRYLDSYACLITIEFVELQSIQFHEHPLSESKCFNKGKKVQTDNGRIVYADTVTTVITELDLKIFREYYTAKKSIIHQIKIARKNYLPKQLITTILQLYKNKTSLKGIEEKIVEYFVSKGMVNSCYGMMATDPVREQFEYDSNLNDFLSCEPEDLNLVITKFNDNPKRFLYYAWGIWVTAYARSNLFTGISECASDYLYSDTDSVKTLNHEKHQEYFQAYNNSIIEDIKQVAAYYNLPESDFMPKDKKGRERIIGLWDFEGVYDEFKSIGAKRYLIHQKYINEHYLENDAAKLGVVMKDETSPLYGYWELTVAGTNKYKAMKYMLEESERKGCTPFDLFDDNLVIPKTNSGRLSVIYIDEPVHAIVKDYLGKEFEFTEQSSVNFEPTEYELHIGADFAKYLKGVWYESMI